MFCYQKRCKGNINFVTNENFIEKIIDFCKKSFGINNFKLKSDGLWCIIRNCELCSVWNKFGFNCELCSKND